MQSTNEKRLENDKKINMVKQKLFEKILSRHEPVEPNSTWRGWIPHASRWHIIFFSEDVFCFSDQILLKCK